MRSLFAFGIVTCYVTISCHALAENSHGKTPSSNDVREQNQRPSSPTPLMEDMTELLRNVRSLCKAHSLANLKPANSTTILEPATNCINTLPEIGKLCEILDSVGVPEATRCTFSPAVKYRGLQLVSNLAKNYSLNLLTQTNISSTKNHILSPLSSFVYVSMMFYGKGESNEVTFLSALGLPKNKIKMAKIGFHQFFKYMGDHGVRINTKFFSDHDIALLDPHFVDVTKRIFNSEIETIDVVDGFMNSRKINEWVATQTNNNVTEIFEPQAVGDDPSIVVANTIYFKGTWKYRFSSSPGHRFQMDDGDWATLPTMNVADYFQYGRIDDIEARFVEIPYESSYNMSMYVILPDKIESDSSKLLSQLRPEILTSMLSNTTEKFVQLLLPKFKIETEVPLHEAFSGSCDMNCLPYSLETNSSKTSESPRSYHIRQAKSKVVFEVDEKGQQIPISIRGLTGGRDRNKKNSHYFINDDEFVVLAANRPFIAIVVSKGKVFIPIFYIDFTFSQFRIRPSHRPPTS